MDAVARTTNRGADGAQFDDDTFVRRNTEDARVAGDGVCVKGQAIVA